MLLLDIFQTSDILKISPERPVPVLKPNKSINLLGGAANVAANISSLGLNASLIANVGIDNKNDILAASNLLNFSILAAVIVIPDLLTPGIKERT